MTTEEKALPRLASWNPPVPIEIMSGEGWLEGLLWAVSEESVYVSYQYRAPQWMSWPTYRYKEPA